MTNTKRILLYIGGLTLGVGIYAFISGKEFSTYFPAMFLGVTLIGSTYMKQKERN